MRNYKKGFLLFIVICMMGVLVACADEPGDANGTSGDEQEGAGGDLVIATISDAVTLDPAGSNDVPSRDIQFNIFERLINQNEQMELEPGLAVSWEAIDETTWEFQLRENVTFHDGSAFNAEVVKANIDRLLDPEVGSSS
ncbi:MAG: glutathione ABC transporter substrate-binding protein, partial [Oceanobacillus sp.]|nr:glutathione ABC transporter substrate-binding protein [Oceanobacillus sp.]